MTSLSLLFNRSAMHGAVLLLVAHLCVAQLGFAQSYVGTNTSTGMLRANVVSGPGRDVSIPLNFRWDFDVTLSDGALTVDSLSIEALPLAYDFPDFLGSLTFSVDQLDTSVGGGVLGLSPAGIDRFRVQSSRLDAESAFSGRWDNFWFYEVFDPGILDGSFELSGGFLDTSAYPQNLELELPTSIASARLDLSDFGNEIRLWPKYEIAEIDFGTPNATTLDLAGALPPVSDFPPSQIPVPLGDDFNGDGVLNSRDFDLLIDQFGQRDPRYDLNFDGAVDLLDGIQWLSAGGFEVGDVNFDGQVDSSDLGRMLNRFEHTAEVSYLSGDLNGDSRVNSQDLGLLLNNYSPSSLAASATAVPESSGPLPLLLAASLVLLLRRKSIR